MLSTASPVIPCPPRRQTWSNSRQSNSQRIATGSRPSTYHYSVRDWLQGDPGLVDPPPERRQGRNKDWQHHLFNRDVISMPDAWEYPWYAAWDLAFHMIPFADIDPAFAREQLALFLREWYMHPNGQLPAHRVAPDLPQLLRREPSCRVPHRFETTVHPRGGGRRTRPPADAPLSARRRRPKTLPRNRDALCPRPPFPGPGPVLRVLPRRPLPGLRGTPPDRLDRPRGQPPAATAGEGTTDRVSGGTGAPQPRPGQGRGPRLIRSRKPGSR